MKLQSITTQSPVELIVSQKKILVYECVEAMSTIAKNKFDFHVKVADNYLMFKKDSEKVCVLAFIEKGLVILQRAICPDFIILLRLAVATMGTLTTKDENDFSELQDIFGQQINFDKDGFDTDADEVTSCDPEEAYFEAAQKLFVKIVTHQLNESEDETEETTETMTDEVHSEEDDSEWI